MPCLIVNYSSLTLLFNSPLLAIAEVYMNQGNEEYSKDDFRNATDFYTEGINVNCKDEELNAKLYSNRGTVQFLRGEYFSIRLLRFLFCSFYMCVIPYSVARVCLFRWLVSFVYLVKLYMPCNFQLWSWFSN